MTEKSLEQQKRPVPHINHTVHLAQAANALAQAGVDLPAERFRIANPMDVEQVRFGLAHAAQWFDDPSFFFPDADDAELQATEYLILLASCLREHLKAGNR